MHRMPSAGLLPLPLLMLPSPVLAQVNAGQAGIITDTVPGCSFQTGAISAACIPMFLAHIVQFIFMLIGIFFLMNIMFGGYQIALSSIQGSDRSKGTNRLIWSIIGFLVAACSFIIMDVVLNVVLG
jgi:hypothetical protein